MKTLQELFNTAVSGVLAQGMPGRSVATGMCLYGAPGAGAHCAVGHIVKDHYSPTMEGAVVRDLVDYEPCAPTDEPNEHADDDALYAALQSSGVDVGDHVTLGMLVGLQDAHDELFNATSGPVRVPHDEFLAHFRAQAGVIAERYGLTTEVLA